MSAPSVRIFIVEDEALIAMELADRLTALGHVICGRAARGEAALIECPAARPDVVLMDVHLAGDLDGVETSVRLRAMIDVPVIFLTAYSDDPLLARAVEADAAAFLVKPFEERELHATIRTVLHRHGLERSLRAAQASADHQHRFTQSVLDALPAQVAIVDATGHIVATNDSWRRAAIGGGLDWQVVDVGVSYLEVCERAQGDGADDARAIAEAIRQVLGGYADTLVREYVCATPSRPGWFLARVSPLVTAEGRLAVIAHEDITQVHEARERAIARDRIFASLATMAPVGIFRADASGRYEFVNRQWCALTGLDEVAAGGEGWVRALHPGDKTRVLEAWAAAVTYRIGFREEFRLVRPDGQTSWVLAQARAVSAEDGSAQGIVGTITDLSERKAMESAMRILTEELVSLEGDLFYELALRKLAALLEVDVAFISRYDAQHVDELRMPIVLHDGARQPAYRVRLEGTPCAELRHTRSLVVADAAQDRFPTDDRLRLWQSQSYGGELLLDHEGRQLGTLAVLGRRALEDPPRTATVLRLFAAAISAEIVRERDHRRYEDLFQFAPGGLVLSDRQGRIRMVNRRAEELFGWTAEELVGQSIEVLVPMAARDAHVRMRDAFQGRAERRTMGADRPSLRGLRKDGSTFPVEIELAPVQTDEGEMIAAGVRDVSERFEAASRLTETRRHLVDTIESSGQVMVLFDAADRVVLFNQQFVEMYPELGDVIREGVPYETLIRTGVARGLIPIGDQNPEQFIQARLSSHRRADSTPVTRELANGRFVRFTDHRSRDGGIVSVGVDITELVDQQRRMRDLQKMDAIGKLTGGMAHDFNNYLGVIIGSLDLLDDRTAGDPEATELLGVARESASRAADLTRSLLAFARRQPLDPQVTDIAKSLQSLRLLLSRSLGEHLVVHFEVGRELGRVRIDVAQFESSIVNLANNARDAMTHGGELRVSAYNVHLDSDTALAAGDIVAGEYVCVEIADTGTGMTADVIARVFEPFFTTKEVGHGTGLGLSMVHGFVSQSGGTVRIYSEPGHGTVVRLFLPAVIQAAPVSRRSDPAAGPPRGSETILVVEDNEAIRKTVIAQLESFGYTVRQAASGEAAVAELERHHLDIALVFSDVVMPGPLNGHALAELIGERFPRIRVLLTSGFPGDAWATLSSGTRRWPLLNKPYRKDALAREVRSVLNAPLAEPPGSER